MHANCVDGRIRLLRAKQFVICRTGGVAIGSKEALFAVFELNEGAVRHPGGARERVGKSDSPFWAEHRSRYHFAANYTRDRTVLDIACGAGYGCVLLKENGARNVIGVDLAWEAMAEASPSLLPGIRLLQAEGTLLPLATGSFDVVTSFETIEHVADYDQFLGELHRVLRRDGLLLLSTPNALVSKPVNGVPKNPFHVREFTPEELASALSRHFSRVELRGQRVSETFRPCPYWDGPEPPERSPAMLMKANAWKMIARMPLAIRNTAARALLGHDFYPGQHDFVFEAAQTRSAHVLFALCWK